MSLPKFGPRCCWCGVILRWWQTDTCRVCRHYYAYNMPSPPCEEKSRWDAEPDVVFWKQVKAPRLDIKQRNWNRPTPSEYFTLLNHNGIVLERNLLGKDHAKMQAEEYYKRTGLSVTWHAQKGYIE